MTIQTCDGPHFTCGKKVNWQTAQDTTSAVEHTRDRDIIFNLGGTNIIVSACTRSFNISRATGWSVASGAFVMQNSSGGYFVCGGRDYTNSGSVSENYQCTNTELYFLDTRYNNAIGKEIVESITFSAAGESCGFKETWGVNYYNKYVIETVSKSLTETYFVVINGVRTVLKTSTVSGPAYTTPLILVYPNPPSLAIPWVNCEDIKLYGFYDYHAVGEGEGQQKIQRDGGDDFYFTDWMRLIGSLTRDRDQANADRRYFEYYLNEPGNASESVSNPGIYISDAVKGSIAVDQKNNVFYSIGIDAEVYSMLTNGVLSELFQEFTDRPQFYPIGVI